MNVIIQRPQPETTYDAPAGNYLAELVTVGLVDQESEMDVKQLRRFIFRLIIAGIQDKSIMVGRNFEPGSNKELWFLQRWLGKEFIQEKAGKVFDLKNLIGAKAEVTINHINNQGHPKPYCHLVSAYPPGSLKLTSNFKEQGKEI